MNAMLHDVLVRIGWITKLASSIVVVAIKVSRRTVDQLLFRQMDMSVVSIGVENLDSGNGGKGPTRATGALLLDRVDIHIIAPIEMGRQLVIFINVIDYWNGMVQWSGIVH